LTINGVHIVEMNVLFEVWTNLINICCLSDSELHGYQSAQNKFNIIDVVHSSKHIVSKN